MKKIILSIILVTIYCSTFAQIDTIKKTDYNFILQDSPAQLFTMRQVNQSYLSTYRLAARELYSSFKKDNNADLMILLVGIFVFPATHEEGHRSILTVNGIGAISQPYMNKYGAAYVDGVTDKTLIDLRDNNFPTYIRLHTAGLESDYMLTKQEETIFSFNQDDFKNYEIEYMIRKFMILQYYVLGLVKFDIKLKEETNELKRDIVGYDTYSATRHLFRPTMDFHRYTSYKELTNEEVKFVNRLGYRSLLNLVTPIVFKKLNFKLSENTKLNLGLGYTMSPFGDFIDENIWLKHKSLNLAIYARQFQNKKNWFNAFGISLVNYKISEKIYANLAGHFWQQPTNFDFNTSSKFTGGAVDLDLKYFILDIWNKKQNGFSIDLGLIYKTKGFLPEELYLDKHLGFRFGTTIRL